MELNGRAKEVKDLLLTRRSVRKYRSDPISREMMEELLEAACWAPSGSNRQPWYFVGLTKPEDMEKLSAIMREAAQPVERYLHRRFPSNPEVVQETASFLHTFGGAPAAVLVFLRENYKLRDSAVESTAAAVENLLLMAHGMGLGSCWVNAASGGRYAQAISETFAPDKGEFLVTVTLGYPDSTPDAPVRKPGRYTIL